MRAVYEDDVIKMLNEGWIKGIYPNTSNVHNLPTVESELIKCDYVKAYNEVTMNKTFSAWRYLNMLNDFKEYGYVLVKKRGGANS